MRHARCFVVRTEHVSSSRCPSVPVIVLIVGGFFSSPTQRRSGTLYVAGGAGGALKALLRVECIRARTGRFFGGVRETQGRGTEVNGDGENDGFCSFWRVAQILGTGPCR